VLYASARRQGDLQAEAWGLLDQAESLLTLGEQRRALELLTAAAPFLEKNIGKSELVWGHGLYAAVLLRAGEQDRAFAQAAAACKVATSMAPVAVYCYEGYASAAEVLLALAETPQNLRADARGQVLHRAKQACKALAAYARVFPIARPRSSLCQGLLASLHGNEDKARQCWRSGIEAAIKLRMPYEEARLRYETARHLPQAAPERDEQLTQAREAFERLHASYDVAQAKALNG